MLTAAVSWSAANLQVFHLTTEFNIQTFTLDQRKDVKWWASRTEADMVRYLFVYIQSILVYFDSVNLIIFFICLLTGRDC